MLDTGHPGKHSGITPGCIFPCFLPENVPPICFAHSCAPCDVITTKMVGHTLKYIVSKHEVNWTNGSRDIDTFVSPLSLNFPI